MNKILTHPLSILIPAVLLISACGSSKNAANSIPDWALNPNDHPQSQQYLMAVGTGSTLDDASKSAYSNLAQIFQMDIEGSEELITEVFESYSNNQVFTEGTSRLLNNIRIGTNQQLINSSILEAQVGPDATYYALAGMHRMETSRIYSQEISSNIMRLDEMETQADEESNILNKLMLLKNARILAMANLNLSKQQNILMRGSSDTNLPAQRLSRLEDKFNDARQKATYVISASNATPTIISAVSEVFQGEGFSSIENKNQAILDVNIRYQTQKMEMNRENTEFVKWELIIEVKDLQADRSFKTYIIEGRDGALSFEDALRRADFTARNKINLDFRKFINQQLLASN